MRGGSVRAWVLVVAVVTVASCFLGSHASPSPSAAQANGLMHGASADRAGMGGGGDGASGGTITAADSDVDGRDVDGAESVASFECVDPEFARDNDELDAERLWHAADGLEQAQDSGFSGQELADILACVADGDQSVHHSDNRATALPPAIELPGSVSSNSLGTRKFEVAVDGRSWSYDSRCVRVMQTLVSSTGDEISQRPLDLTPLEAAILREQLAGRSNHYKSPRAPRRKATPAPCPKAAPAPRNPRPKKLLAPTLPRKRQVPTDPVKLKQKNQRTGMKRRARDLSIKYLSGMSAVHASPQEMYRFFNLLLLHGDISAQYEETVALIQKYYRALQTN